MKDMISRDPEDLVRHRSCRNEIGKHTDGKWYDAYEIAGACYIYLGSPHLCLTLDNI